MLKKITYFFVLTSLILGISGCFNNDTVLNKNEQDWLTKQPKIRVAVYPYYPPYQFINKLDSIDGILVDHFHLIETKINYTFQKKYYTNWDQLIEDTKNKKVEIVLEIQKTAEKEKYLNFYTETFETPFVIVTRKEIDSTLTFEDFLDKQIAVPEKYSIDDYLRKTYPNLKIKNYPNDISCLIDVQSGGSDAYIGGKAMVNYLIKSEGLSDLRVVTDINHNYVPSIAVHKENKMLNTIIEKATKNISNKERQSILDNWLFNLAKPFYKTPKFWIIFASIFLSALTCIFLIYFYLKFKITQKTKELQIAKDKAEESNRIKTNFIQNISHEIRTPMNGIMGFSELLKSDTISTEERKQFTQIVIDSSEDLVTSLDDILEISTLETKQSNVQFTETHITELLEQLLSEYTPKAVEKNLSIHLTNEIPDDKNNIHTDHIKLNKILSNLVDNAIKFTKTGTITIFLNLNEDMIEVSVKDTGIGIKQKDQEIIFKSFSQSEKEISKNFGGLGLGLAISKKYTDLIGGKISFTSKENEGSTFLLKIPYTPMQNHTKSPLEKEATTQSKKPVVLIAEDGEINFLFLKTLLSKMKDFDFYIYRAENGKEAVDICSTNDKIDLILMDIKMPVMDGYDATKLIKKIRPNLPIVVQTAFSTAEDIEKAFAAGCDDFVAKPVDPKILKPILDKYFSVLESNGHT